MKTFLLVFAAIAIASCNISTKTTPENVKDTTAITPQTQAGPAIESPPPIVPENCYRFTAQKDTYDIRLTKVNDNVSGYMHFNNFQKDDSKGNFTGRVVKDNIIKVIYKFESEGMKSTREIFLKDNGNEIITGIGEEDVKGDSAYIKNPEAVQFTGTVYKKTDCSEIK